MTEAASASWESKWTQEAAGARKDQIKEGKLEIQEVTGSLVAAKDTSTVAGPVKVLGQKYILLSFLLNKKNKIQILFDNNNVKIRDKPLLVRE